MQLDPPRTLPGGLTSLSVSGVALYLKCPLKFRRRYFDHDYEPVSPALIVGHAVGRAEGTSYQTVITDRYRPTTGDVLDVYSDEFDLKVEEETGRAGVDWEGERRGRVKDSGAQVLKVYHRDVAPKVRPVAVERKFEIALPHVDWTFTGYIDLEAAIGRVLGVDDFKARSHTKGPVNREEADGDLQATGYLFAKRAEEDFDEEDALAALAEHRERAEAYLRGEIPPRRFRYHNLVRPRVGAALPRDVVITETTRTDEQLDSFLALLYNVAAEIEWRYESDVWTGAPPGAWWCSERWCGFWHSCPFGGAHRPAQVFKPRPVRRPTADDWLDAVKATARRDGTTTAQRVGAHLGVSTRSAAGGLGALRRREVLASKQTRRKGSRPVTAYWPNPDLTLEQDLEASLAANGVPAPQEVPA